MKRPLALVVILMMAATSVAVAQARVSQVAVAVIISPQIQNNGTVLNLSVVGLESLGFQSGGSITATSGTVVLFQGPLPAVVATRSGYSVSLPSIGGGSQSPIVFAITDSSGATVTVTSSVLIDRYEQGPDGSLSFFGKGIVASDQTVGVGGAGLAKPAQITSGDGGVVVRHPGMKGWHQVTVCQPDPSAPSGVVAFICDTMLVRLNQGAD